MYCKKCGAELIEDVCPMCSQPGTTSGKDEKIANKFFVSPNERVIAILGDSYIENVINNGNLKNGFAVVSDKRIYFQGTSLLLMLLKQNSQPLMLLDLL